MAAFAGTYADFACRPETESSASAEDVNVLVYDSVTIDEETLTAVCSLPNVRFLKFRNCAFTAPALTKLGQLHGVRTLVLDGSNIDDKSLETVCLNSDLHTLSIAATDVTEDGAIQCIQSTSVKLIAIGELNLEEIRNGIRKVERHVGTVGTLSRYMVPRTHLW